MRTAYSQQHAIAHIIKDLRGDSMPNKGEQVEHWQTCMTASG